MPDNATFVQMCVSLHGVRSDGSVEGSTLVYGQTAAGSALLYNTV